MASNVYEFVGTRNARLVRFLDKHDNVSGVLMKVVTHLEGMTRELGGDLGKAIFDTTASPDGRIILIKIRK